jgi:hypothetical protein
MKRILIALGTLLLSSTIATPCTLTWDAVHVQGVKYKVYFTPPGTKDDQVIVDTADTKATLLCPVGLYTVTAYTSGTTESERSNIVSVKPTPKAINLIWGK